MSGSRKPETPNWTFTPQWPSIVTALGGIMATTFTQSVLFAAPPATVYALYAEQKLHMEATGSVASIKARAGASFTAWDGYISGITLHAEKDRMIVQTWRADDWPSEAPDSFFSSRPRDRAPASSSPTPTSPTTRRRSLRKAGKSITGSPGRRGSGRMQLLHPHPHEAYT